MVVQASLHHRSLVKDSNVTNKRANIVVGAFLLAIAIGYGYMTTQLPTRNLPNTLGIDFMPWVYCIFLAFLSVLLIISGLVGRERPAPSTQVKLTWPQIRGTVVLFTIFIIYVFLIDVVGFIIITPFAMFALMYLEGIRKYPRMALASFAITASVYVVFRFIFEISITGIAFL